MSVTYFLCLTLINVRQTSVFSISISCSELGIVSVNDADDKSINNYVCNVFESEQRVYIFSIHAEHSEMTCFMLHTFVSPHAERQFQYQCFARHNIVVFCQFLNKCRLYSPTNIKRIKQEGVKKITTTETRNFLHPPSFSSFF